MSKIQVELQETMGSDASIANAAWTSTYDKERREDKYDDPAKVEAIVTRCVNDGHAVPLESVVLRFWCRWPVFVDRQHMTHRIASHNGLSGRYRTLPSDFMGLPDDVREIWDRVVDPSGDTEGGAGELMASEFAGWCETVHEWYSDALEFMKEARAGAQITDAEYKRVREVLRAVLPTAFMVERTTITNLVSFANYQRLRNSKHAQPEIRQAAQLMLAEVVKANVAPIAVRELMRKGWLIAEPNHDWSTGELP